MSDYKEVEDKGRKYKLPPGEQPPGPEVQRPPLEIDEFGAVSRRVQPFILRRSPGEEVGRASTLVELFHLIRENPADVVGYHMTGRNDFANWARDALRDDLVYRIIDHVGYTTPEDTRTRLLTELCRIIPPEDRLPARTIPLMEYDKDIREGILKDISPEIEVRRIDPKALQVQVFGPSTSDNTIFGSTRIRTQIQVGVNLGSEEEVILAKYIDKVPHSGWEREAALIGSRGGYTPRVIPSDLSRIVEREVRFDEHNRDTSIGSTGQSLSLQSRKDTATFRSQRNCVV